MTWIDWLTLVGILATVWALWVFIRLWNGNGAS